MKAKLKKIDPHYFLIVDDKTFGSTMEPHLSASIRHALSLKNCQAIERGYDLDELTEIEAIKISESEVRDKNLERIYKRGFQKALELMGDKKFSEEDLKKAIEIARNGSMQKQHNGYGMDTHSIFVLDNLPSDEIIQSLQQTEWDVEIEMICPHPSDTYRCGIQYGCDEDGCNHPNQVPYLDKDGCIILKRVL